MNPSERSTGFATNTVMTHNRKPSQEVKGFLEKPLSTYSKIKRQTNNQESSFLSTYM